MELKHLAIMGEKILEVAKDLILEVHLQRLSMAQSKSRPKSAEHL